MTDPGSMGPSIVVEASECSVAESKDTFEECHENDQVDQQNAGQQDEKLGVHSNLNRGGSFRSLFGGPRSRKSGSKTLSPPHKSTRSQSTPGPDVAAIGTDNTATPHFLARPNQSASIFRIPKPHMKLLKKTGSVRQLYRSLMHALRTAVTASEPDECSPELTKHFFESILRSSETSKQLNVVKVVVKDENELGRHFCSQVQAVDVIAKDPRMGFVEYHLIVKCQPSSEDARRFLQPNHTFEKEVLMYSSVFHDMAEFVRSKSIININCEDGDVIDVPKCYYAKWAGDKQPRHDLIILENLYMQGFEFALDSPDGLDRLHSELVVRELAKLHAISFCMKSGDNDVLLKAYECLKDDSLYCSSTEGFTKRTITPVMASLAEVIKAEPKYAIYYDWFVDLAKNFHRIQMETVGRRPPMFSVICHGDLWLSNLLFRYDQQKPVDVRFIDFQSARFASLATDLSLFLFTAVQSGLRKQMLGELVSLYYTTFVVSTRSLNYEHDVFTLEELFVELERHIIYGFLEGIWYLDILHLGHVPSADTKSRSPDDDGVYNDDDDEADDDEDDDFLEDDEVQDDEDDEKSEQGRARGRRLDDSKRQERRYRHRFFQLLEETLFLMGKRAGDGEHRRLRDISLAPHLRTADKELMESGQGSKEGSRS